MTTMRTASFLLLFPCVSSVLASPPSPSRDAGVGILGQGGGRTGQVHGLRFGIPLGQAVELPPCRNFYRLQLHRWSANAWGLVQWTLAGLPGAPSQGRVPAPRSLEGADAHAFFQAIETASLGLLFEQVNVERNPAAGGEPIAAAPRDTPADMVTIARSLQQSTPAPAHGKRGHVPEPGVALTLSTSLAAGEASLPAGRDHDTVRQGARRRYLALLGALGVGRRLVFEVFDPHLPTDSPVRRFLVLVDPYEGDLGVEVGWTAADREEGSPGPRFVDASAPLLEVVVPGRGAVRFSRAAPGQLGMASQASSWSGLKLLHTGGDWHQVSEMLARERRKARDAAVDAKKRELAEQEWAIQGMWRNFDAARRVVGIRSAVFMHGDEQARIRAESLVPVDRVIDPSNIQTSSPIYGAFDLVDGNQTVTR